MRVFDVEQAGTVTVHYWMSHIRNLESFAADYSSLLDAWEAGGVNGLVVGPMQVNMQEMQAHSRQTQPLDHSGEIRAAFDPDPQIYEAMGVPAPEPPPAGDADLREQLQVAFQAVVDRGWELWLFDPLIGAEAPSADHTAARMLDPQARAALAARMLDTVAAYPMATGVIIDGPAWGFEITEIPMVRMARRRLVFDELPDSAAPGCARLGYDYDRLVAGRDRLWQSLHELTPAQIAAHEQDSPTQALRWLGGDELVDWMQFRVDALTSFYEYLTAQLRDRAGRPVQLAVCPRQPPIAAMAGYDYERISHVVDVIMPKFYYWQRGYDGTVGTAYRWARTLRVWNPELSWRDASQVARLLFGPSMPVVDQIIDFDRVMTAEFVGELTRRDAEHSVRTIADRARIVPWVDTGRAPHDGDPLTARHLDAILTEIGRSGIGGFNFFNSTNLTAADWAMLSHHGGSDWDPDKSGYLPPDRPTV